MDGTKRRARSRQSGRAEGASGEFPVAQEVVAAFDAINHKTRSLQGRGKCHKGHCATFAWCGTDHHSPEWPLAELQTRFPERGIGLAFESEPCAIDN
jgi:hypothetical protein